MKPCFFIKTDEISRIENCSQRTALRRIDQVRYALNKRKKNPVTLKEYCDYWQIPEQEVKNLLTSKG